MSKRPEVSWSVHCDWPGCGHQFEYEIYSIFGDGWDADEIVSESEGWLATDGVSHYCDRHPAAWSSDPEQIASMSGPFLLIHDDGDQPSKVTLVGQPE